MSCKMSSSCAFKWLSGFFAAPALIHLVRFFCGFPFMIGEWQVTMAQSGMIAFVGFALSAFFCFLACQGKCDES